jgi:thioredoxin 1
MLAKTLEDVNTMVPVEVVDIDVHPEVATDYGIRGVPTLVMLDGNVEMKRMSGTATKTDLGKWLND